MRSLKDEQQLVQGYHESNKGTIWKEPAAEGSARMKQMGKIRNAFQEQKVTGQDKKYNIHLGGMIR